MTAVSWPGGGTHSHVLLINSNSRRFLKMKVDMREGVVVVGGRGYE